MRFSLAQYRGLKLTFPGNLRLSAGLRCFSIFLAGFCLGLSSIAQVSKTALPNAPAPKSPSRTIAISNVPIPLIQNPNTSSASNNAGDVSLYTVVDLALRNSKSVGVAEAQAENARRGWKETRDVYIPNFSLGSGLGYSYGFPLGTPTVFNVTSSSLLFSFSQHDYIRSAKAATKAAMLSLKNTRQQVILDTSLTYIELDKTLSQIAALQEAEADADKLLEVMQDRVQAGLETNMQMTRARLTRAQIALRAIQMEDHADELRQHLSGLTGLDPALIQPAASSIPQLPTLDFSMLLRAAKPPSVQAADATADSKMFAGWGDERQNYRPTVSLFSQYALFSKINNYTQYYNKNSFQYNNYGIGIQAVWPLFDPLRKDKAMESRTEADRARQQADLAKIQNDESNLALWHSLRELEAQAQVATLQQQLAKDMLAATVTEMNSNAAAANGAPVTPQQAEQSRVDERTSYVDMRDAQFNVTRVKLNLLNAVGELEDWAKESGQVPTNPAGLPTPQAASH